MPASRRLFLQSAAWSGVALAQNGLSPASPVPPERRVNLNGDGVMLSPPEYARLLTKIIDEHGLAADSYLEGGAVEQLEHEFAKALGKERALFLPTGTLANHLAVRELAGEKRRAIVQQESHLYNDEGDCAQLLSGINLVPLGPGRAAIQLEEIREVVERSSGPPFPVPVGAISIESPVRRAIGEVVSFEEMKRISAYAREKQIGLHLDGARMYLASAYTGVTPLQYSALFDTVYVSMYKYFNAPFGAVLAGPAAMLKRISTLRHAFGSMVYRGWESVAVALHFYNGFRERYQGAVRKGEELIRLLQAQEKLQIERVPRGSNIARVKLFTGSANVLQERLADAGIVIRTVKGSPQFTIQVNETINRRPPEEIARDFARALA